MNQGTLIGQILADLGVVDASACGRAAAEQPARPTRFASRLLALGTAEEGELVRGLAVQLGVPGIDLSRSTLDLGALDLVPRQIAEESLFLPVAVDAELIHLAMANPQDGRLLDELQFVSGRKAVPYVALQGRLRELIPIAYEARTRGEATLPGPAADASAGVHVAAVTAQAPVAPSGSEEELVSITVELEELGDEPLEVAGEASERPAAGPAAGGGRRVLVVDDEEEIRTLIETALLRAGYRVETAARGLEALHKIKSFEPEAVVLDAMLPEVHGFEICRKIRTSKRFGHVPVIMVSAVYRGWRYAQDVTEVYGATDFVEKPFRLPDLISRVAKALEGAKAPESRPAEARERAMRAYRRGVGMLKVGKIDGAIEAFREGAGADPFEPALQFSLGRALEVRGDGFGAMAAYERAVELEPRMFSALKSLGALYEQKGFRRKAIETWERAVPAAPDPDSKQLARESLLALLEAPAGGVRAASDEGT